MEKFIKNDKNIFDINIQYYRSLDYLTEFITDNKHIDGLFSNFKGVTVSLRDELINEFPIEIKSYTEDLGDPLSEIEDITFQTYIKYPNNKYFTNDADIYKVKLHTDLIFDPVNPTIINYFTNINNSGIFTPNTLGTTYNSLGFDGNSTVIYGVVKLNGTTEFHNNVIQANNQTYFNIALKDQIGATQAGNLFFSEMEDNNYLVDGTTYSVDLTTSQYDLNSNNIYYADNMPSYLGTNSLFRPFSEETSQALNISFRNNFKLEYYPTFDMEYSNNKLTINNYTASSTLGDVEVYPQYLGYDIALDENPLVFQGTLELMNNNTPENLLWELNYTSDVDFTISDADNIVSFTASADNAGSIVINDLTLIDDDYFVASFTDVVYNLMITNYFNEQTLYQAEGVIIDENSVISAPIEDDNTYIIDIRSDANVDRTLTIEVGGIQTIIEVPATTGAPLEDTIRIFLYCPAGSAETIQIIGVDTSPNTCDIAIYKYFTEPTYNLDVFKPSVNNTIDLNKINAADSYTVKFQASSDAGELILNGNTYSSVTQGDNEIVMTASGTFSILSVTHSFDNTLSNFILSMEDNIYTRTLSDNIEIDMNINHCLTQPWNLLTFNYTDTNTSYFFNGTPIRYINATYSESGIFDPFNNEIADDNTLIISNQNDTRFDTLTLDNYTYSRSDVFNLMDLKYVKNNFEPDVNIS